MASEVERRNLSLEDKAACNGGSIDRTHGPDPDFHVDTGVDPRRPAVWKVYVRKRKEGYREELVTIGEVA